MGITYIVTVNPSQQVRLMSLRWHFEIYFWNAVVSLQMCNIKLRYCDVEFIVRSLQVLLVTLDSRDSQVPQDCRVN